MRTSDHVLSMRIAEGSAGYGVYMMLLELLRDATGRTLVYNPANLAFAINEPDAALVGRVCESYGLFDGLREGKLYSPWLNAQMADYDQKRQQAVEAGRRGAAKRYAARGAAQPDAHAGDSDPIATLKAPYGNKPNSDEINSTEINPTSSKSKLLGLSCGKWSGEELYIIARRKGSPISELDREECAVRVAQSQMVEPQMFNPSLVLDIAEAMKFSHEQYVVLLDALDGGRIGTPRIQEAIRIYRAWSSREFRAKFPFEYLMVKLLEIK